MRKATTIGISSLAALGLSLAGTAVASAAQVDNPTGPITRIAISEDLNCDVGYLGDEDPEFYAGTACATLVAVGGTLYGPETIPAGGGAEPRTPWTPVAQSQSGAGTAASPYTIVTDVTGGGLTLRQVDTYVVGANSYQTFMTLSGPAAADAIIYHGADCYLQDSDDGFGSHNPSTGAVTCRAPGEEGEFSETSRIEEFVPLTVGSNFLYDDYDGVWQAIGSQQPLPDLVRNGTSLIDNGMALSWSLSVPAGGSTTVGMLTNFSTIGLSSLTTSLSTAPSTVFVGAETTVTATINNPNLADQSLTSAVVTIPAGTSYVAGSTSGAPEPTVSGTTLTFAAAGVAPGNAALTFSFKVRGDAETTGTLALEGTVASGAPVLGSTAALTVESEVPEPTVVTPTPATVVQGSCPAPGRPVGPTVTLPDSTQQIVYSMSGDVVAGSTVTVTAAAQTGFVFPATVEGWTISDDKMTATATIQLNPNPCEPVVVIKPVAPVAPTVVQATCTAGPSVKLPTTAGIEYTMSTAKPKAGEKVTVTAKALEGYKLIAATGWTLDEEAGTATWSTTLAKAPTNCKGSDLPTTGANPALPGILGAAALLLGAGGFITYRKWRLEQ